MTTISFANFAPGYLSLWKTLAINAGKLGDVDALVAVIVARKPRYEPVERATGVPWFVIGIIHSLEAGGPTAFKKHLHNGDPLTARTVQVPAGRPLLGTPPFDWDESAIDALEMQGLHKIRTWSFERIAYEFERYNGMGYRRASINMPSPYLWSFSNHYTKGKFKSDGVFDSTLVSKQVGALVALRRLVDAGHVALTFEGAAPAPQPPPAPGGIPAYPGHVVVLDDPDMASVRLLQARLNALGIGVPDREGAITPLDLDGEFGPLTDAAVRQFQARSEDASGMPLSVDGEVGPLTWQALFGGDVVTTPPPPAASGFRARLIAQAQAELAKGVRENPLGSNRGTDVDRYIRDAGLNPTKGSYPWCVCFVFSCFKSAAAGEAIPFPKTAGVHDAWTKSGTAGRKRVRASDARGNPALVKAGQVFFLDHGGGLGHAGIVVAVNGDMITTIEGNTNKAGGREGIGVFQRTRAIRNINLGFCDYF